MSINPFINPAESFLKRTELARAKMDLAVKSAGPKTVAPEFNSKHLSAEAVAEKKAQFEAELAAADQRAQAAAQVAALEAEAKKAGTGDRPPVDYSIHYAEPEPTDDPAEIAKRKARLQRKQLGLSEDDAEEADAKLNPGVKAGRAIDPNAGGVRAG